MITGGPAWLRTLVRLVGLGLIVNEAVVHHDHPSFPILVVSITMIGLIRGDALDRLIGQAVGRRDDVPPAPPVERHDEER